MELKVGFNSYVTLDEASDIMEDVLLESDASRQAYDKLSDDDKKVLLYKGFLDMEQLLYRGVKIEKLQFPRQRRGGFVSDMDKVQLAQVVNALSFLPSNQQTANAKDLARQGINSFKLGEFSISINPSVLSAPSSNSGQVERILSEWLRGGVRIV